MSKFGLWGKGRRDPWMHTNTGRLVCLEDPDPSSIELRDIVVALSHLCRYTGHTHYPYTVAEHSVRVADALLAEGYTNEIVFTGLMHDATEAFVGDIASPLRKAIGRDAIQRVEDRVYRAIALRFGLPRELPDAVKLADLRMLATEAPYVLTWPPPFDWGLPETAQPYPDQTPKFWFARTARSRFLALFAATSPNEADRELARDLIAELT